MGGWQKRVKLAGFLAEFGGVAAAEQDGLGEVWALDRCLLVEVTQGSMAGHVATNGDTARRNARASVPSTG